MFCPTFSKAPRPIALAAPPIAPPAILKGAFMIDIINPSLEYLLTDFPIESGRVLARCSNSELLRLMFEDITTVFIDTRLCTTEDPAKTAD